MGVDQDTNMQVKKSTYLGFKQESISGPTKAGWITRIHAEWIDREEFDTPISVAVWRANLVYPDVQAWGPNLFGYSYLGYSGDDSR